MKRRGYQPALTPAAREAIPPVKGDIRGLLADLEALFPPDRRVVSPEGLYSYECDAQTLDRALPLAVVLPNTTEEVAAAVRACVKRDVPFLARGAGTGLSGGAVSVGSLVIATSRMNKILGIDVLNRQAWVQPGVVNMHLTKAVAGHNLHYAPDPSSQYSCTIGGNVAENSGGPHTLKYGVTTNHILALEVVLPDGSVVEMGGPAADAPGYDLTGLFVGSEGTFGIATKILVRLTPNPEGVRTILAIFDTVNDACHGVTEILARGILPAAIEMIDQKTLRAVEAYIHAGLPTDAAALLLVEADGLVDDLDQQAERIMEACRVSKARDVRLAKDEAERAKLWKGRKQAFGALGRIAPNYYTHDGVIPRTKLPEVLDEIERIAERNQVIIANVFHAGDGNLHPLILFDGSLGPDVLRQVKAAGVEILRACLDVGGSITGEHGVGMEKNCELPLQYGPDDLAAMLHVKRAFDPDGLANPAKIFPTPSRCREFSLHAARSD